MIRVQYTSNQGNVLDMIFSALGLMMIMVVVLAAVAIFVVVNVLRRKGEEL